MRNMKLYCVRPNLSANDDKVADDAKLKKCVEPIAELIAAHLSSDPALFAMSHKGEISKPSLKPDISYDYAQVVRIENDNDLKRILMESGDPYSGKWMLVRSLVTCRSAFYGYDGQAFVCVPSDSDPILSPDDDLISVDECSALLSETDYMDGLLAEPD